MNTSLSRQTDRQNNRIGAHWLEESSLTNLRHLS